MISERDKLQHTLDELLAGMLENPPPLTKEDLEWLYAPAVGKEYPNGYPDEDELLHACRKKKHGL